MLIFFLCKQIQFQISNNCKIANQSIAVMMYRQYASVFSDLQKYDFNMMCKTKSYHRTDLWLMDSFTTNGGFIQQQAQFDGCHFSALVN